LPGQDDRSSGSRTLPLAELNPLLNPLLGENMGRWAEVYFTSPPEKREQAVLELLRELEANKSRRDQDDDGPIRASDLALAQTSINAVIHTRCEACGGDNPVSHKYCGLCGAGLGDARDDSIFGGFHARREADEGSVEGDESLEMSSYQQSEDRQETQYDEENRNDPYQEREFRHQSSGNGLSLFQTPSETGSEENSYWVDEPEPSRPYRYYIGAVLAVIILVLGYMAWRGTQASQNSHEASAPPPPAASDSVPAQTPTPAPAKTASQPSAQTPAVAPVSDQSARTSSPAETPKNSGESVPKSPRQQTAQTAPTAAPRSSAPAEQLSTFAAQPAQSSAGNGGEELAIAERYLNGAVGQRRDTTEAAKWLWKSVAKHNGQATVLLSDLYLKGNGVSKNCDQARVLLDSAARKGVAGAGERLRNLPAFGCE